MNVMQWMIDVAGVVIDALIAAAILYPIFDIVDWPYWVRYMIGLALVVLIQRIRLGLFDK